jgi:hypothetical protein
MFNNRPPLDDGGAATGARNTPFSLIGGDVVVTGNISATVDLHVDGRIEGDVSCATLVQGTESAIKGNVVAKVARIAGTVEGSIEADELVIERSAKIVGESPRHGHEAAGPCEARGAGVAGFVSSRVDDAEFSAVFSAIEGELLDAGARDAAVCEAEHLAERRSRAAERRIPRVDQDERTLARERAFDRVEQISPAAVHHEDVVDRAA